MTAVRLFEVLIRVVAFVCVISLMGTSASRPAEPAASPAADAAAAGSIPIRATATAAAADASSSGKGKPDCLVCSDRNSANATATATDSAAAPASASTNSAAAYAPPTAPDYGSGVSSELINAWDHNNINEKVNTPSANPHRALAYMHSGCPLNRREIGRSTWAYLHTVAAYYPDRPSAKQADDMSRFMYTMADTFPCGYCSDKTVEHLAKHPPQTASQRELSVWLCGVHNEVNERMGKPVFRCDADLLLQRWKTGPKNGGCS